MVANSIQIFIVNIEKLKSIDDNYFRQNFPARYERAQRFKFEADRLRCLAAGYLLKEQLGLDEEELRQSENGKPYVPGGPEFNLSHSGDYAVLAVADEIVGVDIEKKDSRNISVADRVCTADELAWMSGNAEERFWTLWTLKEAASKVVGKGLAIDYRSFSVLPLIQGNSIELEGRTLYGRIELIGEHCLAVVSPLDAEMLIRNV